MWTCIIILLLTLVCIACFVAFGFFFWLWVGSIENRDYPTIPFDSFVDFYAIAPQKWVCHDDSCVTYQEHLYERVHLRFSFLDSIRYWFWHCSLKRGKKKKALNDQKTKLVQWLQEDIDNYIQETKEALR